MKTIKELEAYNLSEKELGYITALRKVVKLIDEISNNKNINDNTAKLKFLELKARIEGETSEIIMTNANENVPIIELKANGDIFVKGKLIENDKEVVKAMKEFLKLDLKIG